MLLHERVPVIFTADRSRPPFGSAYRMNCRRWSDDHLSGQHNQFGGELEHDCVTRLDRDWAASVNHAWNSRHSCRARGPAVPMAYLCRRNALAEAHSKQCVQICAGVRAAIDVSAKTPKR